MDRYIGLISGTSADGIDAVIVDFAEDDTPVLVEAMTFPYPASLRERIEAVIEGRPLAPEGLVRLDAEVGSAFGSAARDLLGGHRGTPVRAIGSHGQTVAHHPDGAHAGSLQIGDPARIAHMTGLQVVADFRRADIAAGGQGAPLAPLFHATLGAEAVVNLGGIANLSVIVDGRVRGFDTGPGNTLLDGWAARHGHGRFDAGGAFAGRGKVDEALLEALSSDPYFQSPPPKSSGREHFNLDWLDTRLGDGTRAPEDVQATLAELTALTVADAVRVHARHAGCVHVCGGGARNADLVSRLAGRLAPVSVETTDALGVDPDFMEAVVFAWLARARLAGRSPRHLRSVTGAMSDAVLGAIWLPPET